MSGMRASILNSQGKARHNTTEQRDPRRWRAPVQGQGAAAPGAARER